MTLCTGGRHGGACRDMLVFGARLQPPSRGVPCEYPALLLGRGNQELQHPVHVIACMNPCYTTRDGASSRILTTQPCGDMHCNLDLEVHPKM